MFKSTLFTERKMALAHRYIITSVFMLINKTIEPDG